MAVVGGPHWADVAEDMLPENSTAVCVLIVAYTFDQLAGVSPAAALAWLLVAGGIVVHMSYIAYCIDDIRPCFRSIAASPCASSTERVSPLLS